MNMRFFSHSIIRELTLWYYHWQSFSDPGFASGLLSDAKQLYQLGKKNPGVANPIIPKLHKFYK